MNTTYRLEWKSEIQPLQVFGVGDVIPVLNSRVSSLFPLPVMRYGLGVLTSSGVDMVGEGIVFRHRIGITPPTPNAGIELEYHTSGQNIATPFCLGWKGESTAHGWFKTDGRTTLLAIYETLFQEVRSRFEGINVVLIELVGLLPIDQIYDRALKKPVNQGNVLITSPEHRNEYFRAEMIRQDLNTQKASGTKLFPLAIVGIGYLPGSVHPSLKRLETAVFYAPPTLSKVPHQMNSPIKTHSHAIGWKDNGLFQLLLNTSKQEKGISRTDFDLLIDQTASLQPDYIVHLDEWSQLYSGYLQVFIATSDAISFQ